MDRPDLTDLEARARDVAYTAVGFCVLGFQQLQVKRRELSGDVGARGRTPGTGSARLGLVQIVRTAETVVDPVLEGVERALPGTAKTAVHQSRTAAKMLRKMFL